MIHPSSSLPRFGVFLAAWALSSPAQGASDESFERAQPLDSTESDGVYGRFDGDLALSLGAGVELDFRDAAPRPMAMATARFYQAIGAYGSLSQSVDTSDRMERVLGVGLLVEPLFLLRWPSDWETNTATWDLLLDSLGLHVGGFFAEPRGGSFGSVAGIDVGLGMGIPLMGSAEGPWLRTRGLLRAGPVDEPTAVLQIWLDWQWFLHSGAVGD